jgi:hypothetical protein
MYNLHARHPTPTPHTAPASQTPSSDTEAIASAVGPANKETRAHVPEPWRPRRGCPGHGLREGQDTNTGGGPQTQTWSQKKGTGQRIERKKPNKVTATAHPPPLGSASTATRVATTGSLGRSSSESAMGVSCSLPASAVRGNTTGGRSDRAHNMHQEPQRSRLSLCSCPMYFNTVCEKDNS